MAKLNLLPHLTEKTLKLAKAGQYTFVFSGRGTKQSLAEAVARLYGVHPDKVTIVKSAPKTKGSGRRTRQRPGLTKAVVNLKKGEKIADFIVEEKKK